MKGTKPKREKSPEEDGDSSEESVKAPQPPMKKGKKEEVKVAQSESDSDGEQAETATKPLKKPEVKPRPKAVSKDNPKTKTKPKPVESSSSSSEDQRGIGDMVSDTVQGLVMQTVKNEVERKIGLPGVVDMAMDGKRKVEEAVDMVEQRNQRMMEAQAERHRRKNSDSEAEDTTPAKQNKQKYRTLETPESGDHRPKPKSAHREVDTASGTQRQPLVEKSPSDEDSHDRPGDKPTREVKPLNLADVSADSKSSKNKKHKTESKGNRSKDDSRDQETLNPARIAPNNGKYMLIPEGYILSQPAHPGACFFHLVFKIVGVFCYMFLGLIVSSTITNFLTVFGSIILDFWICKNITGRILAGYRWWNDIDDDGEEIWFYESYDYELRFQPIDTNVFWWGMGLNTIFWSIMCVLKILSLSFLWGLLTLVAAMLNWMNFYAYYKCHRAHHAKLSGVVSGLNQMFNPLASFPPTAHKPAEDLSARSKPHRGDKQATELHAAGDEDSGAEEHKRNVIMEGPGQPKKKLFGLF